MTRGGSASPRKNPLAHEGPEKRKATKNDRRIMNGATFLLAVLAAYVIALAFAVRDAETPPQT